MLQHFLSLKGVSLEEIDHRAELLEKMVECHNLHLDKLNLDQDTHKPITTLSEKCNLFDFSACWRCPTCHKRHCSDTTSLLSKRWEWGDQRPHEQCGTVTSLDDPCLAVGIRCS